MRTKKRFEELTFTDDFMFCRVLENDPELCKELVELILDRPIDGIQGLQKQHVIDTVYDARGVRFDIHFRDDDEKIYSVEMQTYEERELSKRFRFYSSSMDQEQLDKGRSIADLQDTYVIFICTFNVSQEYNLAKYTFERVCMEEADYCLNDGAHLIVVCAENSDQSISVGLQNLLGYIAGRTTADEFTSRLESAVNQGRISKEWRRQYMLMSEYLDEARAEGIKQGIEQGMKRGIEQGMKQGIQQGIEQGMKQGIEKGVQKGIERGIEQGIEQGMKQGIQQGLGQGRESALQEMIRSMHQDGLPIERIAHIAKVTEEYVKEILK